MDTLSPVPHEKNNIDAGPIPLKKEGLPSAALLHVRPASMPAPTLPPKQPPPVPAPPVFRSAPAPPHEHIAPSQNPLPPPPPIVREIPPASVPLPTPIILPSAFEAKPGKKREQRKGGLKNLIFSAFLIVAALIVALYFWGAHLARQGA